MCKLTGASNNLALLLRLSDTLEAAEKQVGPVDDSQVDAKVLLQRLLDLLAFIQAHDAIINEDSMKSITNCLLHELCSHSRVDATGDGSDDLCAIANELSDAGNFCLDKVLHDPVGLSSANIDGKVVQNFNTARCLERLC